MKTKKNIIRDLPRGVTIRETRNGHGRKLWRIRLGRKFTKAGVIERNFASLEDARRLRAKVTIMGEPFIVADQP